MSIHDNNLIISEVDGQWAKEPVKDINTKFCQVTVAVLSSHIKSFLGDLANEQQHRDMEDLVDVTDNANCTGKRAYIEVSRGDVGFDQLKSMCANSISLGQVMFVVDILGTKTIIIIYVDEVSGFLLNANTKTWYMTDNDATQKFQFIFLS